jgi:crotonobetainyl-CoA:carnitine CoA-transferase CaiB-like acyl-CoA transferase
LDFAINGRRTRRLGNRHEFMSPHGCYPRQGTDELVLIAARDEVERHAFCDVVQHAELITDVGFADPLARHQHQDELDAIINWWTTL